MTGEYRRSCIVLQGLRSLYPQRIMCLVFLLSQAGLLTFQRPIPSPVILLSVLTSLGSQSQFFFTQSFRDFHFPNIFYSSVIDFPSVLDFCFGQSHSYQEVVLSPSTHQLIFYFLPTFDANTISFLIPPSSWFLVFLLLPKLAGKVSFPSLFFFFFLVLHLQLAGVILQASLRKKVR